MVARVGRASARSSASADLTFLLATRRAAHCRATACEPPAADAQPKSGTASRATVVLPSGAGKTVCALRVTEALRAQLTLVLVPSIELVSQTYREWERWRGGCRLSGGLWSLRKPRSRKPRYCLA